MVSTREGFEKQVQTNVVVQVGSRVEVNFVLTVGTVNQTVTVTALPPDLNTTTAGIGVVFDRTPIESLPVNSRSALALAALTPGAMSPFGSDIEGQGDRGDAVYSIQINGAFPGESGVVIDGMNMALIAANGQGNISPTIDTLAEFKVESGTLDASYGYTAGGVINMVSRSGTNRFHGGLYEYIRNDALDAKNYFTPAGQKAPEFRYNQFGGYLGGPIKHDKAFFFSNYEEYRYIKGVPAYITVPTPQERQGDFSDLYTSSGSPILLYDPATTAPNPSGSGQIRQPLLNNNVASEIDPVALAYQNALYPLPNTTPSNAFTHSNNYVSNVRTIDTMRQAMARVDYHLSQQNSLFARYWYYQFLTNNPDALSEPFWRTDNMKNQNLVLGDILVLSPRLINDFHLGGSLNLFGFSSLGEDHGWTTKLGMPDSVPSIGFPSMSSGLPTPNNYIGDQNKQRLELVDTLTAQLAKHNLSFGIDLRRSLDSNDYNNNPSGSYTFSASMTDNPQQTAGTGSQYASFLIGALTSMGVNTWLGTSDRQTTFATFVQDHWKVLRVARSRSRCAIRLPTGTI